MTIAIRRDPNAAEFETIMRLAGVAISEPLGLTFADAAQILAATAATIHWSDEAAWIEASGLEVVRLSREELAFHTLRFAEETGHAPTPEFVEALGLDR